MANEGRLVTVVKHEEQEAVLAAMRALAVGENAVVIGEILAGPPGMVSCTLPLGGLEWWTC